MSNRSSVSFDESLREIPRYGAIPAMLPFVGQDYKSPNHAKLMILGESFYFPEESTIHKDAAKWYSKDQFSLDEEEIKHIDCRGQLECDWPYRGQKMYREINSCLAEIGLPSRGRPVSQICFTNTFMRPARDRGESFRHCCEDIDVAVSIDTLIRVVMVLCPDLVIFASKYSWDKIAPKLADQISGTTFEFVYHPADHFHWNVEGYSHGRKKFISILKSKWARKQGILNGTTPN